MKKSYKGKNDNLEKHQKVLQERNRNMIQRTIEHIEGLGGKITMSSVSRVTYEIADPQNGEKGITLAGISKNPMYRAMIEEAAASLLPSSQHTTGNTQRMSTGDARLMLHAFRVEKLRLEGENRVLKRQLLNIPQQIETVDVFSEKLLQEHTLILDLFRSFIYRLNELEITYRDSDGALILALYDEVVVPEKAMTILFKNKELDNE